MGPAVLADIRVAATLTGHSLPDGRVQASISVFLIDLEEVFCLPAQKILEELPSLAPSDCPRLVQAVESFAIVIVEDSALCIRCKMSVLLCSPIPAADAHQESKILTIEASHLVIWNYDKAVYAAIAGRNTATVSVPLNIIRLAA